jgi:hypothetical protein
MSVRPFFMVLILLALALTLFLVMFLNLLTLNCEVSFGQSPMGARHCPSGLVIMD